MIAQIILLLFLPVLTASLAQLCLKKGVLNLESLDLSLANFFYLIPKVLQNVWLVAGIFLFGLSFLFYIFVLSKFQLNIVYPIIVSSGIISISLASWLLFKESLSLIQILGIVFVIFGVFLLFPKG